MRWLAGNALGKWLPELMALLDHEQPRLAPARALNLEVTGKALVRQRRR
jgi:hypothetical protein